jgi:hypothetical protein
MYRRLASACAASVRQEASMGARSSRFRAGSGTARVIPEFRHLDGDIDDARVRPFQSRVHLFHIGRFPRFEMRGKNLQMVQVEEIGYQLRKLDDYDYVPERIPSMPDERMSGLSEFARIMPRRQNCVRTG